VFRLQLRSVLEQFPCSFKLSLLETGPRVKVKGLVKLGVELERDLEFSFGFLVALAERNRQSARDMSLRQIRVKQQSLLARIVGRLQVLLAGLPVHVEVGVAIGDSGEGARISRIEFDRPRKKLSRKIVAPPAKLIEELPAAQIEVIGFYVGGRRLGDGLFLALGQHHLQGCGD